MNETFVWLNALTDKAGRPLATVAADLRGRENAVLICSFGGDEPEAPLGAHLAAEHGAEIADGLRRLAEACGSREVILYGTAPELNAVAERLASAGNLAVSVIAGPSSPVLREPTALYSAIDTGVIRSGNAEEEYSRTFLSYGYHGRPTLAIDAETAYQVYRVTHDLGLTKHMAVIGGKTEIIETDVGTALSSLVELSGAKAALLGGVCGRYLSPAELEAAVVSFDFLFDSIKIFGDGDCIVTQTAALYGRIKDISCQKCVLCREGSWQLAALLGEMTEGKASRDDIALVEDIGPLIAAGALCAFGRHMVMPALTALAVRPEEYNAHVVSKSCAAGQCRGLMSYLVDPSVCTGCGECLDSCPEEAIEGEDGFIHMIDEKLCVKCGKCVPACPEGAIKCGEKFKVPKKLTKIGKFH